MNTLYQYTTVSHKSIISMCAKNYKQREPISRAKFYYYSNALMMIFIAILTKLYSKTMKSYILLFILAELFSYASGQSLRLVGGASDSEGRVEVYYENYWGTICDDLFDDRDAAVICNVLGYVDGTNMGPSVYGSGTGYIWLDDLECVGNEISLDQCSHRQWGYHNCYHSEDVGVQCNNDVPVRLVDGTSSGGRVEVYHGGVWGTICNDRFTYKDASVICKYLGFTQGLGQITVFPEGLGQIWLDEVECIGTEAGLHECTHNNWGVNDCGHDKDVGITCIEQIIRLANGGSNDQGRVEIFHNGQWGTICDDSFDDKDAFVVCKYLGFDTGVRVGTDNNNPYGEGIDPIWLDDVQCTGTEESLIECSHWGWGSHNCYHYEDVDVQCNNYTTNPTPFPTHPTNVPSIVPTLSPTNIPSKSPSFMPSYTPTTLPTSIPTMPSNTPTSYSNSPTSDSSSPTTFPTYPTSVPTPDPSFSPEQQLGVTVTLPTTAPGFSSQEQHFESTHSTDPGTSDNDQAESSNIQNLFTLWQYIMIGISFLCICCIIILWKIYRIRKKTKRREKKSKAVVDSFSGPSHLASDFAVTQFDNSLAVVHEFQTPGDIENEILDAVIGATPDGNELNDANHHNMNSIHIKTINDNINEDLLLQTVVQNEGQVKITKIESAVRLELNSIENDNEYVTDNGYGNDEHKQENVLLDSMLSDVLEMQDLDPNKIHQKNIENIKNNDTDSDNSDNMYEKSENEKSNLKQDNDMKNEDSLSYNEKQRKISNGKNMEQETVTKGGNNEDNEQENALLDGMLSDILKMKSLDPNKIHQKNMNDVMNGKNADTDSDDSDNMYE